MAALAEAGRSENETECGIDGGDDGDNAGGDDDDDDEVVAVEF